MNKLQISEYVSLNRHLDIAMQCMPKQVIPRSSLLHFLYSRKLSIENKLKMQNYAQRILVTIIWASEHTCNDCG